MKKLLNNEIKFIGKAFLFILCIALVLNALISSGILSGENQLTAYANSETNEELDTLNITLDFQSGKKGSGEKETHSEILDNDVNQVSLPTRENYAFYGYYTGTNKQGTRVFNAYGEKVDGVDLADYANKTLYAYWVKTLTVVDTSGNININEDNGHQHTAKKTIGLDFALLKELGYSEIEVQLKITIRAQDKGEGRDMWIDISSNGNYVAKQMLLSNANLQYTDWQDNYATVQFDISKFNQTSEFNLGFAQTERYTWTDAIWWFNSCQAIFCAVDRAPHEPLPQDRENLAIKSYTLADNSGYNIYNANASNSPLGSKTLSSVSLDLVGGSIITGNVVNGIQQYGYYMTDEYSSDDNIGIKFLLKYNYTTNDENKINGTNYYISEDSYYGQINGVSNVGVVQSGALLVQKLKAGGNPNNPSDWTWQNPISKGTTESFHTTDFTDNYRPAIYNGNPNIVKTIEGVPMHNSDGTYVYEYDSNDPSKITGIKYVKSGDDYVYQDCYKIGDGYVPIYIPSGEDLKNGLTLKILFVYELKSKSGNRWNYINVAEETTLSIYPSNAKILFQNLNFTSYETVEEAEKSETAQSELIRQFGEVSNSHNVNDAFRVNFNGNTTYKVEYSRNDATNQLEKKYAYDDQVFTEPGKYRFKVTPVVGEPVETIIYVNERGIYQNFEKYFGNGLITEDSHRIFTTTEIVPVYLAGKTYWATKEYNDYSAPLVGRIGLKISEQTELRNAEGKNYIVYNGETLIENVGYFKDEAGEETTFFKIIQLISADSRNGQNGALTESGFYYCEFANNKDFFNNKGKLSGDIYYFSFQFQVTDEVVAPSLNEEFISNNIGFADYDSCYFGVSIPTKGTGNVVFAFTDFDSAKQLAYEYYRTLVVKDGDAYIFNEKTFDSLYDLFAEIDEVTDNKVEIRYFDASDSLSYLTITGKTESVTELEINKDVIVFNTATTSYFSTVGLPFLNDKPYAYLDENGTSVTTGKNELRFISIANFESNKVTLTFIDPITNNLDPNYSWVIPYDYPIQNFLETKNAPSGKYEIKEENLDAVNIYYGIYIEPSDNQTTLKITRIAGSNQITQDLTKANGNIRFSNINGLILHSATNPLDPYGIVKIVDTVTDRTISIMSLEEVEEYDLIKEEQLTQGHFRVDVVDRLGNIISYYADIYDATSFYSLTFKDGDSIVIPEKQYGSGAYVTLLPLSPHDSMHEFAGWQDEKGNVLKGDYFFFDYNENTVLTAVWHFKGTTISLYDGLLIETYETKPDAKVKLYDYYGTEKDGLTYFRYVFTDENGIAQYRLPELQTVPNVQTLRIDTLWKDTVNTITKKYGDAIDVPSKDGYIFYGYSYTYFNDKGEQVIEIFTKTVDNESIMEPVTLYALYLVDPEYVAPVGGIMAGFTSFISGVGDFAVTTLNSTGGQIGFSLMLVALLAVTVLLIYRKKKSSLTRSQVAVRVSSAQDSSVILDEVGADVSIETKPSPVYRIRKVEYRPPFRFPKLTYRAFGIPLIAFILVCALMVVTNEKSIFSIRTAYEAHAQELAIEREIEEKKAEYEEWKEAKEREYQQYEEYIADTSAKYTSLSVPLNAETDDETGSEELSDELRFLYALIETDLYGLGYYDVFSANLYKDKRIIKGIAYSYYDEVEEEEDETYCAGFIANVGEDLSDEIADNSIIIPTINDEEDDQIKFFYTNEFIEEIEKTHYIAFGKYCTYAINGATIEFSSVENNESIIYDEKLGVLYSYDDERIVFDLAIGTDGNTFLESAYTTSAGLDYDLLFNTFINDAICYQDSNMVGLDSFTITAISIESLHEYVLHGQDESYLGITPDELYRIESQLANSVFYYVNSETGAISTLDISDVLGIYKAEQNAKNSDTFWSIFSYVLSATMIVVGTILCFTPAAALGAGLIVGGIIGIAMEVHKEEVTKFITETIGKNGAQAAGGAMSMTMGGITINIGTKLIGKHWIGTLAGILLIVVGAVTIGFGASEFCEATFDYNFIKEWTGISDLAYNNIYKSFNYASTIAVIAYGTVTRYYKAVEKYNALRKAGLSKAEIRELTKISVKNLPNSAKKNGLWDLTDDAGNMVYNTEKDALKFGGVTKDAFAANGGNGYVVSRANPNIRIPVKNGFPQFDEFAKGIVRLDSKITANRDINFDSFNKNLADKWSIDNSLIPDEYLSWLKTQKGFNPNAIKPTDISKVLDHFELTWHEVEDGFTGLLVPRAIHSVKFGGVPHLGGVSATQKYAIMQDIMNAIRTAKGVK